MTTPRHTVVPLLSILASLMLTSIAVANEPKKLEIHYYERSAPTLGAARQAIKNSETASAQPFNFTQLQPSDELMSDLSAEQRARLEKYGPWLDEFGISTNAQQLIDHIADSRAHGLNPEAYNFDKLEQLSGSLRVNLSSAVPGNTNTSTIKLRSAVKKEFSYSFALFSTHIGRGVVEARDVQRRLFRDAPTVKTDDLLEQLASGSTDVNSIITSLEPTHLTYTRLKDRMRSALTELASGVQRTTLETTNDTLELSDHSSEILELRRRLIETGDLPANTVLTPMFDSQLLIAVETFQRRHGLDPDGKVGKNTKKMMNSTVREEITELAINLERWRWMPRDLGDTHIFINLPSYRLQVVENQETALDMRVVIGSKKHQTPVFSRDISYMQVNPTWTVPRSITNRELVPRERRKPGYLASRNFTAFKVRDGKSIAVPYSEIDSSDYEKKNFPYFLRQAGGEGNALGRMKFMMPNPYSIYLHDTQAKGLFNRHERAYSHGCIRLSEPDQLAHLLLGLDGNNRKSIKRALRSSTTDTLKFKKYIPTHMAYFTTWVDENNELQQRKDVYKHNNGVRTALLNENTVLSTLSSSVDENTLLIAASE